MPSVLFMPYGSKKAASSRLICWETAKYLAKRHWKVSVGKGDPKKFNIVVFQKRYGGSDLAMVAKSRKAVFQLSEAYYLKGGGGRKNGIIKMARKVNAVTVSSRPIQHWFKHQGIKTTVIPTGLDFAALQKGKKRGILTICWIGALLNEAYLKVLVKPLNTLWKKYDFELRIIGGRKPHLPFTGKRHFLKWQMGLAEKWVSECHIGVAPLFRKPYEFAKPPSKPVLYMAQGLAVVATKTPPYMDLIESGKNGFLVDKNDPKRWERFLEVLLTDETVRNSFIAEGKISCQPYSASAIARQWDKFLGRVIKR